jgi:hypothetical protein
MSAPGNWHLVGNLQFGYAFAGTRQYAPKR